MELTALTRRLPPDYWDRAIELYSGETVLDDYTLLPPGMRVAERVILTRFLAVQYFTNCLRGDWEAHLLRQQRSAALNALGGSLVLDRELRMLRQALLQTHEAEPWSAPCIALLLTAAGMAHERSHYSGALALYRVASEAARSEDLWAFAAAAARGIGLLAQQNGDLRAQRRWQRRARALERRARVA